MKSTPSEIPSLPAEQAEEYHNDWTRLGPEAARAILKAFNAGVLAQDGGSIELQRWAVTVARALLSSPRVEGPKWQTMESAPRDSTDVLVGFVRRRPAIGWYDGEYWLSSDNDERLGKPVKWMSLSALSPPQGE
jgi:hypothetical protein